MPVGKRPFYFTTSWDDGTVHDLRLAELLVKYSLPATFYMAPRHQYGRLAESDVRELAGCFEIGAHTMNHTILTRVSDNVVTDEVNASKAWVEQVSSVCCRMFCFPQGKFRKRHLRILRDVGFDGARTVELLSCASPRTWSTLAIVPTTIQVFPHGMASYMRNIVRRHQFSNLWTYLSHATKGDWKSLARSLLISLSRSGGVFHLWGHAWEIEKYGLWADLEELLRTAQQLQPVGNYVTNGKLVLETRPA
jgi:peptidoglycan/xylan/chitin deacetylase (PgdA/CDA1 family)